MRNWHKIKFVNSTGEHTNSIESGPNSSNVHELRNDTSMNSHFDTISAETIEITVFLHARIFRRVTVHRKKNFSFG